MHSFLQLGKKSLEGARSMAVALDRSNRFGLAATEPPVGEHKIFKEEYSLAVRKAVGWKGDRCDGCITADAAHARVLHANVSPHAARASLLHAFANSAQCLLHAGHRAIHKLGQSMTPTRQSSSLVPANCWPVAMQRRKRLARGAPTSRRCAA